MKGSVVVRRDSVQLVKKYRRYARTHSTIPAHLPPCIDVQVGDRVRLAECRALSKTVSFVVVERMKAKEAEQ
jgi:small subunit ribosomal protein S17